MAESNVKGVIVRDVLVDFFGSLVPGTVFVAVGVAVVVWPLLMVGEMFGLFTDVTGADRYEALGLGAIRAVAALRFELTIVGLMLAYMVGHFFYRQDIKVPDKRSFRRIRRDVDLAAWVAGDEEQCEFPYLSLRRYLEVRGMDHLADLVPWPPAATAPGLRAEAGILSRLRAWAGRRDASPPTSPPHAPTSAATAEEAKGVQRTKIFITALKLRILATRPESYSAIARNEAHVRLNSSTWYMSTALMQLAALALLAVLLVAGLTVDRGTGWVADDAVWLLPVSIPGAVLVASAWTRVTIEKALHYQRVREIVFVLETAHFVFQDRPHLIRDMCPGFLR